MPERLLLIDLEVEAERCRGPLQILDCMQPRFGGGLLVLRAHLRAEHAHRFWMHYRSEVFEELAELTGRHVLQDPLRENPPRKGLVQTLFLEARTD